MYPAIDLQVCTSRSPVRYRLINHDTGNLDVVNKHCAIADKERMCFINGQVVHDLRAAFDFYTGDGANPAEGTVDSIARTKVGGFYPATPDHRERMLGRRFDAFTVNHDIDDDWVFVCPGGCDKLVGGFANF